jgi:hypothetical protein
VPLNFVNVFVKPFVPGFCDFIFDIISSIAHCFQGLHKSIAISESVRRPKVRTTAEEYKNTWLFLALKVVRKS